MSEIITYKSQGKEHWVEKVEAGWLETSISWAPSVIPRDFDNTILFGKGYDWFSVSYEPIKEYWVEGYGKPWVDRDGNRYQKAYCHYNITGFSRYNPNYYLSISGGDDEAAYKTYSDKESALRDLELLKTGPVGREELEMLGFKY